MNKEVTIIIPVYNAGENLHHCLQSIVKQTLNNFVVLLIDDGSTDKSYKVCQNYQKEYPDIFTAITKKNSGVSDTRHYGISLAQTKYIMFMDNDDFIDTDYVEQLYTKIEEEEADIVICGFRRATLEKVMFSAIPKEGKLARYKFTCPWAKIYNRQFIVENNIRFLETLVGEDAYFNISAYHKTDKVYSIEYAGYNWYYEEGSVSNTKQKGLQKECDVLILLNALNDIYKTNQDKLLNYFYIRYIIWYLLFSGKDASTKQFNLEYKRLFNWLKSKIIKNSLPFWSKQLSGDRLQDRLVVSAFLTLHRLGLVKIFALIYCRGRKK